MSTHNVSVGQKGEKEAEQYLITNGYEILDKRYRTTCGEIDIVATVDDLLVFVEVKTRNSTKYGSPGEAVTPKKQKTIARVAEQYMLQHEWMAKPVRFDVIEVYAKEQRICHIADAFFPCID